MYENTGPRAHLMAAELIGAGVDVQAVYRRLYEDMPRGQARAARARARRRCSASTTASWRWSTLERRGLRRAPKPRRATPRGSSTSCARCRERRSPRSCASSPAASARASTKSRCAPPTTTSTSRSIARAQGGGGHRRAAGFSTTLEPDELIAFLRAAIAAQLHASSDGHAAARRLSDARGDAATAAAQLDGVLLIDKPAGISSHDVVAAVRRSLGGVADRPRRARSTRSPRACCWCSSAARRSPRAR